ncbi:hypothetical protein DM01DRAFT_1334318 [Hesseltinella vesiculosa]|uniref:Transcription factor TFIIIC triple barrel domain-containing protein n=1 Tax=Hesseltinella vesiculosa TaxID=101127 RepID=A0A1X2GLM4_9FUNG|nr:hypothetical protein DM01DRAFT_1334318 [Hesseltinella vesiculosa]
MAEDQEEFIEESAYVVLDLGPDLSDDFLKSLASNKSNVAITDLMESRIFTQIDNQTFMGHVEDPVGSNLLFEMKEKQVDRSGLLPMLATMRNSSSDEQRSKWNASFVNEASKIVLSQPIDFIPKTTAPSHQKSSYG